MFDYSAKNLITKTGEEKLIQEELKRVRALRTEGQWVDKRTRLPGLLFKNDSVMVLDKIAEKTTERLYENNNRFWKICNNCRQEFHSVRNNITGLAGKCRTGTTRQHTRSLPQGPQTKRQSLPVAMWT
jgi:hypothetical protein